MMSPQQFERFLHFSHVLLFITVGFIGIDGQHLSQPNIVFILADDLGFNDIGYHARDHMSAIKTPFLDKLAAQGIKLDNYYVQPICSPTRSQLMSGRYQIHTGLQHAVIRPDQPNALPIENTLLPEHLRNCGYDTHMVGKWHLGFYEHKYLPWNRGFNSYFGYLVGAEDYFTRERCYNGVCGLDMWSSETGPVNNTWGEYSASLFARKAIEAIDSRDLDKPMFLYMAYQSVHAPLEVPPQYIEPFKHIKDKKRRTYAGMVSALDESVRNVTAHLEKVGILDNTIIVFSTDNGGQTGAGGNNWPLRGLKGTLWEGGVRGVGFAYGAPLQREGTSYTGLLHVSDWLPTLLSAGTCNANHTLPLDGFNQWNALRGETPSPRMELLHNIDPLFGRDRIYRPADTIFNTSVHAAIRVGPWKLLTGDPGYGGWVKPPESLSGVKNNTPVTRTQDIGSDVGVKLFHIETDPYEHHDLASLYPSITQKLLSRLAFYNSTAVPVRYPPGDPNANPKYHGGFWGPWVD